VFSTTKSSDYLMLIIMRLIIIDIQPDGRV